jgi:hypothetical protein
MSGVVNQEEYWRVSGGEMEGGLKGAVSVAIVAQTTNVFVMVSLSSDLIFNEHWYQLIPYGVVFLTSSLYLMLWVYTCVNISRASDLLIKLVHKVQHSFAFTRLRPFV